MLARQERRVGSENQNPCKTKRQVWQCMRIIPALARREKRTPDTGWPASLCKYASSRPMRDSLWKKKMDRVLRNTVKVVLCTPHTRHTNMHINITHMCIHTHTNMLNS